MSGTPTAVSGSLLTQHQRETLFVWTVLTTNSAWLDSPGASFNEAHFIQALGDLKIDPKPLITAAITGTAQTAASGVRTIFQDKGISCAMAPTTGPENPPNWGPDGQHPGIAELRTIYNLSPLTPHQASIQPTA